MPARLECGIERRFGVVEFIKFVNRINREVPAELDVPVLWIMDELVERWSSALTTEKPHRYAHDSMNARAADTIEWVQHWNENPTPFVWCETTDEILERLGRYCADITNTELSTGTARRDTRATPHTTRAL